MCVLCIKPSINKSKRAVCARVPLLINNEQAVTGSAESFYTTTD